MKIPADNLKGYRPGHPWYYVLGGRVLRLKEIREAARNSGYRGHRKADISVADNRAEPRRSLDLRELRCRTIESLRGDIRRYKEIRRELSRYRRSLRAQFEEPRCNDAHVNMSLKHNHIYNDFAHLIVIDGLLSQQGDLFDLL